MSLYRCRNAFMYLFLFIGCHIYIWFMLQLGLRFQSSDAGAATVDVQFRDIQITTSGSSGSSVSIESRHIERQLQRRNRLVDVCAARLSAELNSTDPSQGKKRTKSIYRADGLPVRGEFGLVRVLEEHRILYCEVPRVACTNWKRILAYQTGRSNATSPEKIGHYELHARLSDKVLPRLSSYSPTEIRHRLSTYFKFMFVRDPLDRLLSTYSSKFGQGDNDLFNIVFGKKIIAMYRANASAESLRRGNDVKHHEFVKYLIDPRTTQKERVTEHYYSMDPHWRSYDDLCHPCQVGYDFIGHYETLKDDVEYLMSTVGFTNMTGFFPSAESSDLSPRKKIVPGNSSNAVEHASNVRGYTDVPLPDVRKLVALYDDDFRLFGYPYPRGLSDQT